MAHRAGDQPNITRNLEALAITTTASSSLFFQLFSSYPILERLSNYLSIADIVALTRTHRNLTRVYKDLVANRWNVDQTLRRFVVNPANFRSQMAKYDALVFGSLPLQFFERVVWEKSDMDVIIKGKKEADAFGKYLTTVEGYELVSYSEKNDYNLPDRLELKTYNKCEPAYSAENKKKKIQVVCSENERISAILRCHTTVVVNFFSWEKAYAIYPLSTMVHHEGYMLRAPANHKDIEMEITKKYMKRGWKLWDFAWPEERRQNKPRPNRNSRRVKHQDLPLPEELAPHKNHPIRNSRRVADKHSWIIPFDITYVKDSDTPDYVLEYTVFTIKKALLSSGYKGSSRLKYHVVGFEPYLAPTLHYRYIFGNWCWTDFLKDVLASKAHESPGEVPGYPRPDGWSYWDDYIPEFYWEWEKSKKAKKREAIAESLGEEG